MRSVFEDGVEDLSETLAAGRTPRDHGPYGVLIGNEQLDFRPALILDPVPNGAQVLAAAGVSDSAEYSVFQLLRNGQLEQLRPDESTDLRSSGVERFVVFRSDRSFRVLIDDRTFEWGASRITGATIKRLAGVKPHTHDVWQVLLEDEDCFVPDKEFADLASPAVERFVTRPILVRIIVNARPREVHKREVAYWEVVKLAFPEAAPTENTVYTINYARGPHGNPEGSMVAGQHVKVKDGMTFYVTVTDKS